MNDYASSRRHERLLLLQLVAQWLVYLSLGWDSIAQTWALFNPDTYATLTIARTWAHGHPLRLLPDQPPGTILSDFLTPLFYSLGYWLGFRSTSNFMFWAYVLCFVVSLVSGLALWRFFRLFTPEVAYQATALCMAFPGIYANIYCTNFGFLFLFFWAAMASLGSVRLFVLCSSLAGLMRPEGVLTYALLATLAIAVNGRRGWGWILAGVVPLGIPPLISRRLTGGFFPQGVVPQNLFHYETTFDTVRQALLTATDQIKGALLGYFPSAVPIGVQEAPWPGALFPGVLIFGLWGVYRARRPWLVPVVGYWVLLTVADSFTVFRGLHYNRHLHTVTPLFVGFGLAEARRLCGARRSLWGVIAGSVGVYVALQFLALLGVNHRSVRGLARDKVVVDFLLAHAPDHTVIDSRGRLLYWADSRLALLELSPATDAELGRFVRYYWRLPELGEAVQRRAGHEAIVFSEDGAQDVVTRWLLSMKTREIASFVARYTDTVRLSVVDLAHLADRPPYPSPHAELDVGDYLSEWRASYTFRDSVDAPLGEFLHPGDGFWDGGRPGVVEERFVLPVPEGGGVLVVRLRGEYAGRTQRVSRSEAATLRLEESPVEVQASGKIVFRDTVRLERGFTHLVIRLREGGMVPFTVRGYYHSYHYWVYPASVEPIGSTP